MKKVLPWILVGILLAVVIWLLFQKNNEPLTIPEIKIDTLFVDIPMLPDTVYKIKSVVKKDTLHLITLHNPNPNHILVVDQETVISEKTYDSDYVNTFIRSYTKCQVDSFECRTIVNWQAAFENKIFPEVEKQFKKQRKRGRVEGVIITLGTTLVATLILLKLN